MKIVLAPNAFKGCLSAAQACRAMAEGVRRAVPDCEIVQVPFSDGGDGLVDVFLELLGAEARRAEVTGPRGEPMDSQFGFLPGRRLAAVEMAKASGLALLQEGRRDPMLTTTYGTGELIRQALDCGAESLVIGIGGSATNDGGTGMAAALGIRFYDQHGQSFVPQGGQDLPRIKRLDAQGLDPRLRQTRLQVVCDVDNPLLGDTGAARVYGPQKGAGPDQVEELESGMVNLAAVIQQDLGLDVRSVPGGGAAGGLGAGLAAFLGARLRSGVEVMLEVVGLKDRLQGANCLLTAEGRADSQLAFGKGPAGVGRCAAEQGIPCFLLAGSVAEDCPDLSSWGLSAVVSICQEPCSLEQALARAGTNLGRSTEQVVRIFLSGRLDGSNPTRA